MHPFNWLAFLTQWSQDILNSQPTAGQPTDYFPAGQQPWLGYPGATETQIKTAEARLGKSLPPSFRAFLQVSNGWRETTPFIKNLGSTEDISWFAETYPDWLNQWIQRYRVASPLRANGAAATLSVSDQHYFNYGDAQDCRKLRVNYLKKALAISAVNDASIYLLNPEVTTENGEWEAWFLADWLPGADRYPSFQALMEAEYMNSREIRTAPSRQTIAILDEPAAPTRNNEPLFRWEISRQRWPGIEIEQVCQWILERVEQAVYSC